jgi:hypothetical protein
MAEPTIFPGCDATVDLRDADNVVRACVYPSDGGNTVRFLIGVWNGVVGLMGLALTLWSRALQARFISCCHEPAAANLEMRTVRVRLQTGQKRLALAIFTVKDVAKGEPLSYFYYRGVSSGSSNRGLLTPASGSMTQVSIATT